MKNSEILENPGQHPGKSKKLGKLRKTQENLKKNEKIQKLRNVRKIWKTSNKLGKTPLLLDLAEYLSQKKFDFFFRKNMYFGA